MITRKIVIVVLVFAGSQVFINFFSDQNAGELDRIAKIYLEGKLDEATLELDKYLKDYPRDDLAWTIKGNLLENKDMDNQAEKAYLTALKINSSNFQATNALGVIYRKSGDNDTAMSYYRKALEIKPGYAQAYSSMAVIELMSHNDKEGLRLAEKAYANDNKDAVIAANLALAYHFNGDIKSRDKFHGIAKKLGYKNLKKMELIYSGELTIREERIKPEPKKKDS